MSRERSLLVTGRVQRSTLERLLHHGWGVAAWVQGADINVALVVLESGHEAHSAITAQVERIRSLGNVGVAVAPSQDDVLAAIQRSGFGRTA